MEKVKEFSSRDEQEGGELPGQLAADKAVRLYAREGSVVELILDSEQVVLPVVHPIHQLAVTLGCPRRLAPEVMHGRYEMPTPSEI